MRKLLLLSILVFSFISCEKEEVNDNLNENLNLKQQIKEEILSRGKNFSVEEREMTEEESKNSLRFNNLEDFKAFLKKSKLRSKKTLENEKELKLMKNNPEYIEVFNSKSDNSKKLSSRNNRKIYFKEILHQIIEKWDSVYIITETGVVQSNTETRLDGSRRSFMTGVTLGLSWTDVGIQGFGRSYNKDQVEIYTRGILNYNIFVEGIGTVYREDVTLSNVYNYSQHRIEEGYAKMM